MELYAKLAPVQHDAITTMAGLFVALVLFAYWILRA
jgi:hypothetical protein